MQTRMLACVLVGAMLFVGCKTTQPQNKQGTPTTELDPPKGATGIAPPEPGDVSRRFKAERKDVVKSTWRAMDPRIKGDFAIDGSGFMGMKQEVSSRVRAVVGMGPTGRPTRVELRPEGDETVAIIRESTPLFDDAVADILLDRIEADLKASKGVAKAAE